MPTDSPLDAPKACTMRPARSSGTVRAAPAHADPTHIATSDKRRTGRRPSADAGAVPEWVGGEYSYRCAYRARGDSQKDE